MLPRTQVSSFPFPLSVTVSRCLHIFTWRTETRFYELITCSHWLPQDHCSCSEGHKVTSTVEMLQMKPTQEESCLKYDLYSTIMRVSAHIFECLLIQCKSLTHYLCSKSRLLCCKIFYLEFNNLCQETSVTQLHMQHNRQTCRRHVGVGDITLVSPSIFPPHRVYGEALGDFWHLHALIEL